jgi:hypothetical protein
MFTKPGVDGAGEKASATGLHSPENLKARRDL